MCMGAHVPQCVESSETTCEAQFYPSRCGFWLGGKHPYPLGRLTGPDDCSIEIEIVM